MFSVHESLVVHIHTGLPQVIPKSKQDQPTACSGKLAYMFENPFILKLRQSLAPTTCTQATYIGACLYIAPENYGN